MATAIVGSRLDYCNSLLAGTSVSNLSRLQLVQNTLARVVAQKSRFDHITPVLSELHWLPRSSQNKFQDSCHHSHGPAVSTTLLPRCTHSTLCACAITPLHPCQYVFLCAKPPWQPLDPFRLSRREFGMHCRVIFRPSQLFLLLEELSNTIFSCVLILTVGHLVASHHLNVSRFVIRHHLLPSC